MKPDRVVIDMKHTRLATDIRRPSRSDRLIRGIRSAPRKNGGLRVVLDLKRPIRPRSFLLDPNKQYGHRLVVDLYPKSTSTRDEVVENQSGHRAPDGARDVVVAVDPGHGGDDPGAAPRRGVHEKDVVLAISRELARIIDAREGMRAVLIRNGDYYVGLRRRMELARQARADLFVSVHADAFRDPTVHGASVYVISRRGASSEAARWLAMQENAADLAGGVSLDDKEEGLATVLLDLSQTASLRASREVGRRVLSRLGRIGPLHKRRVERAGFMVLKAPDIPSILVETGFITNALDERRLMDPAQRRAIAGAIAEGVAGYFEVHPPAGTPARETAPRHRPGRYPVGDRRSLSGIARCTAYGEPDPRRPNPHRRRPADSRRLTRADFGTSGRRIGVRMRRILADNHKGTWSPSFSGVNRAGGFPMSAAATGGSAIWSIRLDCRLPRRADAGHVQLAVSMTAPPRQSSPW